MFERDAALEDSASLSGPDLIVREVDADLGESIEPYRPEDRSAREPTWNENDPDGRWRAYTYEGLIERDKASLDLFWIRDEALKDTANLPGPDVIAREVVEDLRAALEVFEEIAAELEGDSLSARVDRAASRAGCTTIQKLLGRSGAERSLIQENLELSRN